MTANAATSQLMGGVFGLECRDPSDAARSSKRPRFLSPARVDLATARGALGLLCEFLEPGTVWVPSYLCGAIVAALEAANARLRFYAIDERLRVADSLWLDDIEQGDMVVFIDYFGFDRWAEQGSEARRRGAWVVEDACHALLNDRFSDHADYVIFSARKFLGVPDGGVLTTYSGAALPERDLPPPPSDWWLDSLAAVQLRGRFDACGGDRSWFDLFRKAEACAPSSPARMSELTALLLADAVDYEKHAIRRCENYQLLAEALPDAALLPSPRAGEVPLGFPVVFPDRARALAALYAEQIYPPVHWPIEGIVPDEFEASHRLAKTIATLPCDHRYGKADMERMALLVRRQLEA